MRVLRVFAFLLMIVAMAGAVASFFGWEAYMAPGPLAEDRDVVIPRGTPVTVADALVEAGVIRNKWLLVAAAELTRSDGSLHAGELAFPARANLRSVLDVLRTARPVEHRLTIPEGLTAAQIAQLLDHAEATTGETPMPTEGMTMPDTYAYEYGATRAGILARATAAMSRALAQIWAQRDPGLPLASPAQLLTLASIVERETARPDERPHVAGVFLNRLRLGMKLQTDPTVIYAVSNGAGVLTRALSRADLDVDSPYNTYRYGGLPPGPIASPGLASLVAVAHPTATNDLYFVADGQGGHNFARTVDDHNRNVAHYRSLRP